MKRIYILGAAGSIGLQTLEVLKENPKVYQVIGLSLGNKHEVNHEILDQFHPEIVCLRDEKSIKAYKEKYPNIRFVYGDDGLLDIADYQEKGILVNALSGSAGLMPTVAAIMSGKDIALANKETLVMAGDIIKKLIKAYDVHLYPIDSEHSALWQTLRGEDPKTVEKLVITASGGSFRDLKRSQLKDVTLDEALKHPNWSMGAKITIDSATMMNKGLEVIETHHLFDMPYDKIETILHDESIIHGLTYFIDGTVKASMSVSDMKIPIQYALFYPDRKPYLRKLELSNLSFKPMDFNRFPLLKLAYQVGKTGGIMPTVMNAANEAAVKLFLDNKISFLDIERIITETVQNHEQLDSPSIEDIIETDRNVQKSIRNTYEKR